MRGNRLGLRRGGQGCPGPQGGTPHNQAKPRRLRCLWGLAWAQAIAYHTQANTPTVINQIKEGKRKGLAVTGTTQSPLMPQLPTMAASGVKGYVVNTWFGFVAPA